MRPALLEAIRRRRASYGGEPDPADYPALMAWIKANDNTGVALEDWLYAATVGARGIPDLTITVGATGAWGVTNAFTSTAGASPTYARTAAVAPLAIRSIGEKAIIAEFDVTIATQATAGVLLTIGRATSTTNEGIEISWSGINNRVSVKVAGDAVAPVQTFSLTPSAYILDQRAHLAVVWDRDEHDTLGEIQLWVNGTMLDEIRVFTEDPGSVLTPSTAVNVGAFALGCDLAATPPTAGDLTCTYHNCRLWYLDEIPETLATIMAQAAATPDALPTGMAGVQ